MKFLDLDQAFPTSVASFQMKQFKVYGTKASLSQRTPIKFTEASFKKMSASGTS